MPLPVPTTIATGFNLNAGCAYWRDRNQLLLVDSGTGTISAVTVHTHAKTVLGTGWPVGSVDIALSADGMHVYVCANTGELLRAPLNNLNRAAAKVVASGLGSGWMSQIGLDEGHGYAYVVAGARNLLRINLSTGAASTVASGLGPTRGVLASRNGRLVYVSDDSGRIVQHDLASSTNRVVASGLNGPRHMAWRDPGESAIVFGQVGPPGMVMKLDLTTPTPSVTKLAGPTDTDPKSLAVLGADHLLIACQSVVGEVYLTSLSPNLVLGAIGFVPADVTHLPNGYADTTMDPTYHFQVKDAPFGGTLPVIINHGGAWNMTPPARFYKAEIGPPGGPWVEVNQTYSDYWLNPQSNQMELNTQPVNDFYRLHAPGDFWVNGNLGLLLDTTGRPDGLNEIRIRLFGSQNLASEIGHATDLGRSATIMIDNTLPTARIDQILHDNSPVGPCDLVNTGSHNFRFTITAQALRHLERWRLVAYWGDNASKEVASDDYSHHVSPSRLWTGLDHVTVPPAPWDASVPGDTTSTRCAHTFWLGALDRTINGWWHIHNWVWYQKSITIWL